VTDSEHQSETVAALRQERLASDGQSTYKQIQILSPEATVEDVFQGGVTKLETQDLLGKKMLLVGCCPHDSPFRKASDGTITGALLAGYENEAVQLIQAGGDVNAAVNGIPPILVAPSCVNGTIADILISQGANVDSKNSHGETALHLAARFGHLDVVKMLLAHGADINVQSNSRSESNMSNADFNVGWTPLHEAAEQGELEAVRMLLLHKAKAHLTTKNGKTARDRARQSGHTEITKMLSSSATLAGSLQSSSKSPRVGTMGRELQELTSRLDDLLLHGSGTAKLCNLCSSLRPQSQVELARSPCHCIHYPSHRQLRQSATAGCPFCCMLLDCISEKGSICSKSDTIIVRSGTTWHKKASGATGLFGALMGDNMTGEDIRHSLQVALFPDGKESIGIGILRLAPVQGRNSVPIHSQRFVRTF
jgi:hypothetical protein